MWFSFEKNIAIDLGTANTLVYMKGKGIVLREPSVVALDVKKDEVIYVGKEAKDVIGRTPGSIVAVRPLKDGVIADFDMAANMLQSFIRKVCGATPFSKPKMVICVPSGVTEVERRAVRSAALAAGGKKVAIIEEPMAAAIGAGLPVADATGCTVVDIGGGTSEIAVISLGGIVCYKSVKVAGDYFDNSIVQYMRRKHNILIGDRTAEQIKIGIGSAYNVEGVPDSMEVRGRNISDGLPKNMEIKSSDVREALSEPCALILEAIKSTLEKTPPELSADIIDRGITLTGGGALLRGLDKFISEATGIDVHIADTPLDCVVKGSGMVLDNPNNLQEKLADENYMR